MAIVVNPTQLETRELQCKITLQSGTFSSGFNTININSNKNNDFNTTINATVSKTLSNNFTNSAEVIIYGLNQSDIAALDTLGYNPLVYQYNQIELYAQYKGTSQSLCFKGYIVRAWCNYSDQNRPIHFQCQTIYQDAISIAQPINANGPLDILSAFSTIGFSLGCSLQNNGVSGIINNPILTGSAITQLKTLSKQTQTNCVIDNNILKIAPIGKSLSSDILQINANSGLISYPVIDSWGVKFRMRYNPILNIGQYVTLQTSVNIPFPTSVQNGELFNGKWYVYDMQSSLNNNHENWYTDVKCSYNSTDIG